MLTPDFSPAQGHRSQMAPWAAVARTEMRGLTVRKADGAPSLPQPWRDPYDRFRDALRAFLADVRSYMRGDLARPSVTIVTPPPGWGKTEQSVRMVEEELKAIRALALWLAPTHKLLDQTDTRFAKGGKARTTRMSGKVEGGCLIAADITALEQANLRTAGACQAKAPEGEDPADPQYRCRFWSQCGHVATRAGLETETPDVDVVMGPMTFVATALQALPLAVRKAAALIVDESPLEELAKNAVIARAILEQPRPYPALSEGEAKREGIAERMVVDRAEAVRLLLGALDGGRDVASEFIGAMRRAGHANPVAAAVALLRAARRVATSAARGQFAGPNVSQQRVRELLVQRQGQGRKAREEAKLWQVVADRVERIGRGEANEGVACGRIALGTTGRNGRPTVEFAWQERIALRCPVLVLDGSASERLYRAVFESTHDVRVLRLTNEDVSPQGLRQRNVLVWGNGFAKSALLPLPSASEEVRQAAAAQREKLVDAIDGVMSAHPSEVPFVAAPKAVAGLLRDRYAERVAAEAERAKEAGVAPRPVSVPHMGTYGGMRGLNQHAGRRIGVVTSKLEMPGDAVGRQARAFRPEETPAPLSGQRRQVARVLPMRDGGTVEVMTYEYADPWEDAVCQQRREAEAVQGYGRLRAAQQESSDPDDWQVVYWLTNVIPEGTVVDMVVSVDDVAARARLSRIAQADGNHACITKQALVEARFSESTVKASDWMRRHGFADDRAPTGWARCKVGGRRGAPIDVWVWLAALADDDRGSVAEAAAARAAEEGRIVSPDMVVVMPYDRLQAVVADPVAVVAEEAPTRRAAAQFVAAALYGDLLAKLDDDTVEEPLDAEIADVVARAPVFAVPAAEPGAPAPARGTKGAPSGLGAIDGLVRGAVRLGPLLAVPGGRFAIADGDRHLDGMATTVPIEAIPCA